MGLYDADGKIRLTLSPGSGFVGLYAPDGSWYYTVSPGSGFVGMYAPDGSLYVTHAEGSSNTGLYAEDGSFRITTGNDNNGALKVSGLYAPASEAIFTEFTTPPSDTDKTNINNLVTTLKTEGIWDALDILYVLAAADSQAALVNWKNPGTKTLVVGGSPSFTAYRGFTGNGTNTYLETNWTPSAEGVNYTLNDASLWAWCLTSSGVNSRVAGNNSNPMVSINPRNTSNQANCVVNSPSTSVLIISSVTDGSGFLGAQRRSSSDVRLWKNGSQIGSSSLASTSLPASSQWILGLKTGVYDTREVSFAAWGGACISKEASFNLAVRSYMQSVGAV